MLLHLFWSRSTTCRGPSFGSSALPGARRFLTIIWRRCVRRDIAMLGLIFRSVSGQAHTDLAALFGPAPPTEHYHRTRRAANQHDRQLQEERPGSHPALMQRSVFGLIRVWNRLPHHVVHSTCVSAFQASLTELVRERCRAQDENWHLRLSPRRFIL